MATPSEIAPGLTSRHRERGATQPATDGSAGMVSPAEMKPM
jgi:hypothetical protein